MITAQMRYLSWWRWDWSVPLQTGGDRTVGSTDSTAEVGIWQLNSAELSHQGTDVKTADAYFLRTVLQIKLCLFPAHNSFQLSHPTSKSRSIRHYIKIKNKNKSRLGKVDSRLKTTLPETAALSSLPALTPLPAWTTGASKTNSSLSQPPFQVGGMTIWSSLAGKVWVEFSWSGSGGGIGEAFAFLRQRDSCSWFWPSPFFLPRLGVVPEIGTAILQPLRRDQGNHGRAGSGPREQLDKC